jgi:hypothetical protein
MLGSVAPAIQNESCSGSPAVRQIGERELRKIARQPRRDHQCACLTRLMDVRAQQSWARIMQRIYGCS